MQIEASCTVRHHRQRKKAQRVLFRRRDDLELFQEAETTAQKSTTRLKKKKKLELLISLQKAKGFWGLDMLQLLNFNLSFHSYQTVSKRYMPLFIH